MGLQINVRCCEFAMGIVSFGALCCFAAFIIALVLMFEISIKVIIIRSEILISAIFCVLVFGSDFMFNIRLCEDRIVLF